MTEMELIDILQNVTSDDMDEAIALKEKVDSKIGGSMSLLRYIAFALKAARVQAVEDTTSQGKRIIANAPIEYSVYAPSILNSRITITDK